MPTRAKLGTHTDNSVAWNTPVPTDGSVWYEVGDGKWRVSYTPSEGQGLDIMAMPHARSGDGSPQTRLGAKLRIVRVASPGVTRREDLAVFSEALVESYFQNNWIRFLDSSRTLYHYDDAPVVGVENFYAVEIRMIDNIHGEVSEGSPMRIDPYLL